MDCWWSRWSAERRTRSLSIGDLGQKVCSCSSYIRSRATVKSGWAGLIWAFITLYHGLVSVFLSLDFVFGFDLSGYMYVRVY